MEYVESNIQDIRYLEEAETRENIYSFIAKFSFFVFWFFVIYGTHLPFQERAADIDDIATSNIVNQIVFSALFLTSCFALIPKLREVVTIIKREKILFAFLLWCSLSILWSDYKFVSFKRLFQIFTAYTVLLAGLLHTRSSKDLFKYFKILFAPYIIISLVTIFTVPAARDEYGMWRGIATHKNFLGQASLLSALIWFYSLKIDSYKGKVFAWFMLAISIVLLIGSSSTTSTLTFVFIVFAWFLFFLDDQFKTLGVGRILSTLTIFSLIALLILAITLAPDIGKSLFGDMGKDMTFTGRTEIWGDIFKEIGKHPWLGAGFQSFWVLDNNSLLLLYNIYIWLPKQAHNGYIDILNEVGIIGLFILVGMIFNYFINLARYNGEQFWKWFIVAALIINFQESTLFRPGIMSGIMFMFAYLALFTDSVYENEEFELIEETE